MKKIISMLLLVLSLASVSSVANAQNAKQRINREQLAETQAKYIVHELAFDDKTSERFVKTYVQYQHEVWNLGPRQKNKKNAMTDQEMEQAMQDRFTHSQKVLDLRKKYYGIYSEFLSQKQIQRVYDLERKMINRLNKRHSPKRRK